MMEGESVRSETPDKLIIYVPFRTIRGHPFSRRTRGPQLGWQ